MSKKAPTKPGSKIAPRPMDGDANKRITISIAYDWSADEADGGGSNETWKFLRDEARKIAESVEGTWAKRRQPPARQSQVTVRRLRAMHGGFVLGSILGRIEESDVLFFDITTRNPNVMFELGCAMANKEASRRVFTFAEKNSRPPSDLSGLMLTLYERKPAPKKGGKESALKLCDAKGFQAALRSAIIDAARAKGMWADRAVETDQK